MIQQFHGQRAGTGRSVLVLEQSGECSIGLERGTALAINTPAAPTFESKSRRFIEIPLKLAPAQRVS